MRPLRACTIILVLLAGLASGSPTRVSVGPATYRPLFPPNPGETEQQVPQFWLDTVPVTNADFLTFLKSKPRWRRDRLPKVFAAEGYLSHWAGPTTLGPDVSPGAPVVRVSWFAARSYCESKGGRLPTEAEWELAAAASETVADARHDPAFVAKILAWYAQPSNSAPAEVGQSAANLWGAKDLHGLVWEWVADYGNTSLNGDSRSSGRDPQSFCGAGAIAAGDKRDYSAFMRVAFRGSLEANFAVGNLGFRCAYDRPRGGKENPS